MLPERLACSPAVTGRYILKHCISDLLDILLCYFKPSACLFRMDGSHRNRPGYTIGNADICKCFLIIRKFYIYRAPQSSNIHSISHCIFNIITFIALISFSWNQDTRLYLAGS